MFIGYDRQEIVAYHVLCQSIVERSAHPVRFTAVNLASLRPIFHRDATSQQSTEFSFSRFLTPYLSSYAGWSLFMDCDMLVRADIGELSTGRRGYAVMVCQHDYTPRETTSSSERAQPRTRRRTGRA